MTWIKLDDAFPDHPKVDTLSDRAFRVHIRALCYCGKYLTDGVIPRSVATQFCAKSEAKLDQNVSKSGPKIIQELIKKGLWKRVGSNYEINDYLKYQTSKAQAEMEKENNRLRTAKAREAKSEAIRHGVTHGVSSGEVTIPEAHTPTPTPTDNKNSLVRSSIEQEEILEMCNLLADRIFENLKSRSKFPSEAARPTVSATWLKQMELLIHRDHRAPVEILQVIEWCQSDPFWFSNILSPTSLRKKFDQLILKMPKVLASVNTTKRKDHHQVPMPGAYGETMCEVCERPWPCPKSSENPF